MSIKPEDVLPDDKNTGDFNGLTVRKGTVAAALANVEILDSETATEVEKISARKTLIELAPALIALGLPKYVIWKNKEVQKIIDDCSKKQQI